MFYMAIFVMQQNWWRISKATNILLCPYSLLTYQRNFHWHFLHFRFRFRRHDNGRRSFRLYSLSKIRFKFLAAWKVQWSSSTCICDYFIPCDTKPAVHFVFERKTEPKCDHLSYLYFFVSWPHLTWDESYPINDCFKDLINCYINVHISAHHLHLLSCLPHYHFRFR